MVHRPLNVTLSDVDFYAFSAHKLYGPNGLGVLYGRPELLSDMQPWQGGGKMLTDTDFSASPAPVPARFEAGTPNVAGVTAFGETLRWLDTIDLTAAHDYTIALCDSAEQQLAALPGFRSYRSPAARCWPLISMVFITVISPRCWRKKYRPAPRAALCAAAVSGAGHGRLSAGLLYAV